MITVENLLDAYAIALDLWIDPELAILENGHPRENPTPEYAELIRKAVSVENAMLRELCASLYEFAMSEYPDGTELNFADRMRELGVEV